MTGESNTIAIYFKVVKLLYIFNTSHLSMKILH